MNRLAVLALLFMSVTAAKKTPAPKPSPTEWSPTTETYVVQPGDTLWAISERVVGSPWLWPKVWSFNPEITNPHWIYPGDNVRFSPPTEELPQHVELVADRRDLPQEEPAPQETATIEPAAHPAFEAIDTSSGNRSGAPNPRTRQWRRFAGLFVTPKELAEAGTLTNANTERAMLAPRDSVYLTLPGGAAPKVGDKYMVYRTLGAVVHPKTHNLFGYVTQVTGVAAVTKQEKGNLSRAELVGTVLEVERGQYVTPLVEDPVVQVTPQPTDKFVEGVVLAVQFEGSTVAAEQQIVFVDKGSRDGLARGNTLEVMAEPDPFFDGNADAELTNIGTLLVVQATETASTCLVLVSKREIEAGNQVVTVIKS